ncbi:MAG: ABC transporter ATP-binding protein [Pirellulaceae bacterium]|jgi:lipoprotein-releasing system ATP-binding protein|nr:ABC transporter ATP-binding protein [Pirellulaceae bacterium]
MSGLVVTNVTKQFPTRGEGLTVLRGVSLACELGENVAILGPSGSGKSTLLHILGTLDRPTAGTVTLGGEDPFQLNEAGVASFRNRHVGFVFQDHHLLPQLSVLENVLIPTLAEGRPDEAMVARARDLLARVGLSERLEHRPAELSGGERQRVGVARALIRQPKLILADEPTGNLDRTNALAVGRLLVDLQLEEQAILVVVTHSADLAQLLQRRYELDDGMLRTR